MKLPILLASLPALLTGCASPSPVVAGKPPATLPAFYARHSGGIVAQPSDAEIDQAVRFGISSRADPDIVRDSYLSPAATSPVSPEAFHIIVRTPLYLVARSAMEQARAGRGPDRKFIAFARHLGVARLSVSQRFISLATWDAYAVDRELILLRDGVRVATASSIPAWNGADPFSDPADPLASWQSSSWLKHGVEDLETQSLRQSEESPAEAGGRQGSKGQTVAAIELKPDAAVFAIAELRQPGRFEIVLRRKPGVASASGAPREVRFPISFSKFP